MHLPRVRWRICKNTGACTFCIARTLVSHFPPSQTVDFDFHDALRRGVEAYREAEHCMASILMASASTLELEAKGLNFISDRAAFMQDNQVLFTPPPTVQFIPFAEDEVSLSDLHAVCTNEVFIFLFLSNFMEVFDCSTVCTATIEQNSCDNQ